jgi:hypothetical protein
MDGVRTHNVSGDRQYSSGTRRTITFKIVFDEPANKSKHTYELKLE